MNIVLLGAPGSGKGTVAAKLSKLYGIPHISSGDIFRAQVTAKTPLGLAAVQFADKGLLLPDTDEYTGKLLKLVKQRLMQSDCQRGFILDGIPRTLWQVNQLDRLLTQIGQAIDQVILIDVPQESIIARLAGRLVCSPCSRSYHRTANPPKVPNICNKCQQTLTRRKDDAPDVVKDRLVVYQSGIGPVIDAYLSRQVLATINGDADPAQVFNSVNQQLFPRDYLQGRIPSEPSSGGFPFYNLVEIYKDSSLMRYVIHRFTQQAGEFDFLAAPEARALPLFGAMAFQTNKPGIFIRKAGKLPPNAPKHSASYSTAYAENVIEMNCDDDLRGKRVIVLDDGISSGGTTLAVIELMKKAGATVVAVMALVRYSYREVLPQYRSWEDITLTLFDL